MPTGNMTLEKGVLLMGDTPVQVTDIKEYVDDTPPECAPYIPFSWAREMILSCTFAPISKKTKNLLVYGWRASGPVRKRLLRKLVTK